jgi:hypothetical protein
VALQYEGDFARATEPFPARCWRTTPPHHRAPHRSRLLPDPRLGQLDDGIAYLRAVVPGAHNYGSALWRNADQRRARAILAQAQRPPQSAWGSTKP